MARPNFNYPGGRPWSEADLHTLHALYANTNNVELGQLLDRTERAVNAMGKKRGLSKSPEFMAQHTARFKAGLTPWNAGTRYQAGGRSAETQFKPGQRPHTWVPIGSLRIDRNGLLQRKVSDAPGGPHKRWRSVHELVWIEHHGPVPDGHVTVFKPGQKTVDPEQITVDRVECISRAELMRRNSAWTTLPPELARLVQLRGALNRQINRITRKQRDETEEGRHPDRAG